MRDEASRTETTYIALALGVAVGVGAMSIAQAELKWVVWTAAAVALGVWALLASSRRRWLLALFVLSIQTNVQLSFLSRPIPSVGASTPEALILPSVVIAGILLMLFERFSAGGAETVDRPTRWGVEFRGPILLTIITAVFSLINTPERTLGVFALVYLLQQYLVFFVTINMLRSRTDVEFVVKLMLITLVLQSCVYFVQSALGLAFTLTGDVIEQTAVLPRVGGTISVNSLAFGKFITPLLLLSVALAITQATMIRRAYVAAVVTIGMAVLILTWARSVWGGVILGITCMLVVGLRRRLVRPGMVAVLGAAGVALLVVFLPWISERLSADIGADYGERRDLMRMAVNVIKAHPILGSGIGAYPYVFRGHLTSDVQHSWLYAVHNAYLLRAAETGIGGAIAFVWLLWRALRLSLVQVSASKRFYLPIALGLSGYYIALAFEHYWDTNVCVPNDMIFALTLGLLVAVGNLVREEEQEQSQETLPP